MTEMKRDVTEDYTIATSKYQSTLSRTLEVPIYDQFETLVIKENTGEVLLTKPYETEEEAIEGHNDLYEFYRD